MPKIDWTREHPLVKLAAWTLWMSPRIITAAALLIIVLK